MCGIFCSISSNVENYQKSLLLLKNHEETFLNRRGPDDKNIICIDIDNLIFGGFVLWQQGNAICSQPVVSDNLILLYNGDIYNNEPKLPETMSDTLLILNELSNCTTDQELCKVFQSLEGPFSIIFYNKQTKCLYFARDSLGRNSLIIEKNKNNLKIASTKYFSGDSAPSSIELPPLGLYKVSLFNLDTFIIYPWTNPTEQWNNLAEIVQNTLNVKFSFADSIEPKWLSFQKDEDSYDFYKMLNVPYSSIDELFELLLKDKRLREDLDLFAQLLEASVRERVTKTPKYCVNCIKDKIDECYHSKIGILFSGGIDCTILAVLADKFVHQKDSIDLINVAFEAVNVASSNNWDVPDRLSAKSTLLELQRICPNRKWNFFEVNVLRDELKQEMQQHIKHLIYPLTTVLDESIGGAFWFASQGTGLCNGEMQKSSTRVIIVGSGADELFGGYIRHRNAYKRCVGSHEEKELAVLAELQNDWERIPSRNLGRDDRIISDNGKTARAPFIEENVVQFVQSKNPCQRCCFLIEEGVGDKLFLRIYGYTLGLKVSSRFKKRAIQFGSRIANKKQNAKDLSDIFR